MKFHYGDKYTILPGFKKIFRMLLSSQSNGQLLLELARELYAVDNYAATVVSFDFNVRQLDFF